MNIRALLGAIGVSLLLSPATAWSGDGAACRERCGQQAGHAFAACLKKDRGADACEDGAHDAFATCVVSQCAPDAAESCAARCDTLGAEVRAHCIEEKSGRLAQCDERAEAARGRCAEEQC
jgi:hypothetical protein